MNETLVGLVDVICVVYLDDILIYSSTVEGHHAHIKLVLDRLRAANLYAKLSKCEFDTECVDFLGYTISGKGVSMDLDRIKAISEWPTPATFREV